MKIFGKAAAAVMSCIIALGAFSSCKKKNENQIIATVNGVVMSDGLFLNNFATEVYEADSSGETDIDFTLTGEELYNEVKSKQKNGKSYYDIFIDDALEESRRFMIQYQIFSKKENWPTETDIEGLKSSAASYMEQMLTYYGSSMGASTVQEMAQIGYGMTYDALIDYFTLSSTLAQYKSKLQEDITPTEDEIKAFYNEHQEDYKSVEVRHSLLSAEGLDESAKEELYEHAKELVAQYNEGKITFDDIMEETSDVDSSGDPNNDGYYTVQKDSGYVPEFEDWALSRTEASDEIDIVESTYGYHIMMCTKINGLESDQIKSSVETAYKIDKVDRQADSEIEEYLTKDEYKIKDLNREYVDKIAKRTFTGDFSDVEGASSAAPSSSPTAAPEYNDAPADATEIAKFNGEAVLKAYYVQFFSQAMNEAFAEYDFSEAGDSEEEFYKILNKAAYEEYKDGKTYIEYAKERGNELLVNFLAARKMAEEADKTLSEEEKTTLISELDSQIDSMLAYYGQSYGVSTRDDLMQRLMRVSVNDYKEIYVAQTIVSDYAEEVIKDMKPEERALDEYLKEHKDDYRAVTVRRISRPIIDNDGKVVSENEKADIRGLIELLKTKYENGDSPEVLALGYSQSSDAANTKGLIDLRMASSSVPQEVLDWAFTQTEIGACTVIETDVSYELIIIEGFTDSKEANGVTASTETTSKSLQTELENAYKSDAFEKSVEKYIEDNKLALTDINNDVVDAVVKDYLTYIPSTVTE